MSVTIDEKLTNGFLPNSSIEADEYKDLILEARHLARTDLFWLSKEVLGYTDITLEAHGPILDTLTRFDDVQGTDNIDEYPNCFYTPINSDPVNVFPPEEPKKRLILYPRSHFKTTINVVAHTIQLLLNFPLPRS